MLLKSVSAAALVFCLLWLSGNPAFAGNRSELEYKIKAAYIYNFCKFTAWRHKAYDKAETLSICLLGDEPFGSLFDPVKNKPVQDKKLSVRRIASVKDANECQVVFISRSEKDRLPSLLSALKGSGALAISDIKGFAAAGGVVELYLEAEKIRFKINLDAAQENDLNISSLILEMATIVKSRKE